MRHFSWFFLIQQLFANKDFCMETSFCNIFKTVNAITLTKTILESSYEDLQGSWKGVIFKQPTQSSKAVEIEATLSV